MKYDLGCGYRLVFSRRNSHVVFLYIGSHDDCNRWMDRNKDLIYATEDDPQAMRAICSKSAANDENFHGLEEDEYEIRLMSRIDDRILRKIFSAFVEG